MAATAVTKVASFDMNGARADLYTMSIDAASIAAAAQGIETATVTGARAGDFCLANLEAPEANLLLQGVKVTADNTVSFYFGNNITVTTALNAAAVVVHLMLLKRASGL